MRTTIDIPDVLYRTMRARIASEGTTLRHITIALYGDWMQRPGWRPAMRTEYELVEEKPKPDLKKRLPFLGIARKGANLNASHDMTSIRESIAKGWAAEYAEKERRVCEP